MTVRVRHFAGQTFAFTRDKAIPEALLERLRVVRGVHFVGRRESNPRAVVVHLRAALELDERRKVLEVLLDRVLESTSVEEAIQFINANRRRVNGRRAWLVL